MLRRIQKMLCVMLVALLLVSTFTPALAKSRVKAYISTGTHVYKKPTSDSASRYISANTRVYVSGCSGSYYQVQNAKGTLTGYVRKGCVSTVKGGMSGSSSTKKSGTSWKSKVVKKNWFLTGNSVLKKGGYGYIYDIDTGIYLRIKRMGGHNHADVEPATRSDTSKLLKIAGGKFSWKSHAVILKVGNTYVACAINTMPHGDQTIRNNGYDGQFCLHMSGSLCHESGESNSNHQYNITRAYNWAHR